MKPKQPAAIITGTMASPSSPSVRFTELEAPTITKIAKGMKSTPSGISSSLRNGTASPVDSGSFVMVTRIQAAMPEIAISQTSFNLPGRPFGLRFDSFR